MEMPHWKEAEDVRGPRSPWCTVHVTVIVTDSEGMCNTCRRAMPQPTQLGQRFGHNNFSSYQHAWASKTQPCRSHTACISATIKFTRQSELQWWIGSFSLISNQH
jgi:hypothetical protein